jgi:hypothetical protein
MRPAEAGIGEAALVGQSSPDILSEPQAAL